MVRALHWASLIGAATAASAALAAVEPEARIEFVPPAAGWIAGHGDPDPVNHLSAAPRAFRERHGDDWLLRRFGPNGQFLHLWGEGIDVDPAAADDAAAAQRIAEAFWRDHADLLPEGVDVGDLEVWSNVESRGVRYVSHRQRIDGVEVWRASAFVAIRDGRLFWLGVRCFSPDTDRADSELLEEAAEKRAIDELASRGVAADVEWTRLAFVPLHKPDHIDLRLAWGVAADAGPRGHWTAFVDAADGELLALRDDRLFMTGTAKMRHYDRYPGSTVVESEAPYLKISTSDGSDYTDAAGEFTASGSSTSLSAEIRGLYVDVDNLAGNDLTWSAGTISDGGAATWSTTGQYSEAQLHAYRFATDARDYARSFVHDVGWLDQTLDAYANYWSSCNAWWDGDITFLMEGAGCNNTAMVADIVYHEFGHGFHYNSVIWGVGDFYSDTGEGFADSMATVQTGDSRVGPYFYTSGSALRDVEPDQVYPDDTIGQSHHDGLIVGGAVWDLRTELIDDLGQGAGEDAIGEIYTGMVKVSSTIPTTYEAALTADDDNGNLADGTPNACAIERAFGMHGLSSGAVFSALQLEHEPVTRVATPMVPVPIETTITIPECSDATVGEVRLVYSTDGGVSWHARTMQAQGNGTYTDDLPPVPHQTQIRYRIEAEDAGSGAVFTMPSNPADPAYYTYVGGLDEIVCDDFETDSGGWTHALLVGEVQEGADDWMRAQPNGSGGDPDGAYSGWYAWGNDLAADPDWDGMYQNEKRNVLYSPTWDLGGYEGVRLHFRRWLGVEDGIYDRARVLINDTEVWSNAPFDGELHHEDHEWILFDLDISEWAGQPEVQIRWEIETDQHLQFGGWTLDDVCLYEMVAPSEDDGGGEEFGPDGEPLDPDGEQEPGAVPDGGGCSCRQTPAGGGPSAVGLCGVLALLLRLSPRRGRTGRRARCGPARGSGARRTRAGACRRWPNPPEQRPPSR